MKGKQAMNENWIIETIENMKKTAERDNSMPSDFKAGYLQALKNILFVATEK
jgi:hypothetical protein